MCGTPTSARIKEYFPLAKSISWTDDVESVYVCVCALTARFKMKRARYATRRFCHRELKKNTRKTRLMALS